MTLPALLYLQVTGVVAKVLVKAGDTVEEDQVPLFSRAGFPEEKFNY